jgi:hypothetical protein
MPYKAPTDVEFTTLDNKSGVIVSKIYTTFNNRFAYYIWILKHPAQALFVRSFKEHEIFYEGDSEEKQAKA